MKLVKRIGALALVLVLILGVLPFDYANAATTDGFSLISINENTKVRNSDGAWLIYMNHSGSFTQTEGESFTWPALIGGQNTEVTVLRDGGMALLCIWPSQIASDGSADTTLVLKAGTVSGSRGTAVRMAEDTTLCFNKYGVSMNQSITPDTAGIRLTQLEAGSSLHIYARASAEDAFGESAADWSVRPVVASGVINGSYYYTNTNGVTIGDTFYTPNTGVVEFIKQPDSGSEKLDYFINPNNDVVKPAVNTELTFKGLFIWNGKLVEFAPSYFQWNGTAWKQITKTTNYSVTFTSFAAEISNSNLGSKGIYFTGTPENELAVDSSWQTKYVAANSDSGIYINNTKQENANIRKISVGQNTFYWVGDYTNLQAGDVLTVKGRFTEKDSNSGITLTGEVNLKWTGSGWTQVQAATGYKEIAFEAVNYATAFNEGHQGWFIYLKPSEELPGTADSTYFTGLKMSVNGGEAFDIVITKSSHDGTGFIPVAAANLPKEITKDTTIVIKAGKAEACDGNSGIEFKNDFTIYANENGWSEAGFIKNTVYQQLTFLDINEPSGFTAGANAWDFYLEPSADLPGTADVTSFTGLTMEVDGVKTPVTLTHATHSIPGKRQTAFFRLETSVLPKDITKNTTVVIKAGKAKATDSSNGIELQKDFTIYINQYGVSGTEFVKAPVYTKVTFLGLNAATGYSELSDGWNLYLNPSTELPGTADVTGYRGLMVSINDGETFECKVTKSAYQNTAFLHIHSDVLPGNVTGNTKIVLKAGRGSANDGNAIELQSDFTIYANKYGWSTTGYLKPVTASETDAELAIDRATAYGGNKNGLYLTTTDHFPVDTTWASRIRAVSYDDNSGVFLNGEKIDIPLIRFADGKLYAALSDAGIEAKDHDKVTIKGLFELKRYGVSYKEVTFYFNGKIWNTTYEKAAAETYTKISVESIHNVTAYSEQQKRWNLYLNVNQMLPGNIDETIFTSLTLQIDGKDIEVPVAHSFQHTLYVPIETEYLPGDCKDGTKITLKAGKALAGDMSTGIELTKDFTFYAYKGFLTATEPTTNTDWQEVSIIRLLRTASYNKEAMCWQVYLNFAQELKTELGTMYLKLPVEINGKVYTLNASQEGEKFLYVSIPDSILPGNTKTAEISVKKDSEATANAGYNGIRITEDWTAYLFNGVISDTKFTEVQKIETSISGIQNVTPAEKLYHVYFRVNKELPGTAWYEYYNDFVYYYNGKAVTAAANKSDSSLNRVLYFPIELDKVGEPKEGDTILIKDGTVITCGGYEITISRGYELIYSDGIWSQYVESNVEKPKDIGSLWSIARFEKGYIPTTTDGSVLYAGDDEYNEVVSTEDWKDFTISFGAKKHYKDEITTGFRVILRGNPISEDEPMTNNLLYGYVISFSALEMDDPQNPGEKIWSGYIELWKNGQNEALIDQYRVNYVHKQTDHPFFNYDVEYDYEFSIYNVTETCACIEVKVNGETVMRYYDEAGNDPFDPAVNAGVFGVYATGPNYIRDDIVELDEVIAEKDECKTGEQIRVAATYPSIIEDAEFTVDSKNATITDGIFEAEKPGTYTISCTYKGKELKTKTIVVTKGDKTASAGASMFRTAMIVIGIVLVLAVGTTGVILVNAHRKKRQKKD